MGESHVRCANIGTVSKQFLDLPSVELENVLNRRLAVLRPAGDYSEVVERLGLAAPVRVPAKDE